MIKNYLLISLRNLRKHFSYTVINVTGLALGFATCLLLVLWIMHELSYDTFHVNQDQVYRSSLEYSAGGQTSKTSVSPTALLPFLRKNFAEVTNGVRLYHASSKRSVIVKKDTKVFEERRFYFADSTFFQIFSFPLIAGDPATALTEPNTIVISRRIAKKYFGEEDAIGKNLEINGNRVYMITGVAEDVPNNTTIAFDFIASFSSLAMAQELSWWSANYETYVLLAPNTDVKALEEKNNKLVMADLQIEEAGSGDYVKYNFLRLTDIHLRSDMKESAVVGSESYLYIFGGIALLVLLIASINYINLATARATDRAKEVGIRKVAGALRKQLFYQFMGDSFVLTFVALLLGFMLAGATLPFFNMVAGKFFAVRDLFQIKIIAFTMLIGLFVAVAAGAYPALAISSFLPVSVLKGNFKNSNRGLLLRKTLVVFQFSVSAILIVATLIVLKQLAFLQDKKLGYEKENIIMFPLDDKTKAVYPQLRSELFRQGTVVGMATATESPTQIQGGYNLQLQHGSSEVGVAVTAMAIDVEFVPTLDMKIISGRSFNETDFKVYEKDTVTTFILNESALKEVALSPSNAIGQRMNLNGREGQIVGIVNDFHFAPLHEPIAPLVLFTEPDQTHVAFAKLKGENALTEMKAFEQTFKTLITHRPLEFSFLNDQYDALYKNEKQMSYIGIIFASLAIVIACLGLVGLVSFTAMQKTKEIGIRKVLGASIPSIFVLITKEFSNLILLSLLIGIPISWWFMGEWLNGFAYKTTIGVGPILLAALACLLIAFIAAGYQALKAARLNPVDTLKNE
jgi:putative ABC transport system permease protein